MLSFCDLTSAELSLDAPGVVPWWPQEHRDVTLRQIITHMINETARHAGHADILRELIDGAAGMRKNNSNLPDHDDAWWAEYRGRLVTIADGFGA